MPSFYVRHEYLFVFLTYFVFSLVQAVWALPIYEDTDCYTHALRVIEFLQNGTWKETVFPYYNHPFGDVSVFTRFLDVVWSLCALPFLFSMDLKNAVYYGGYVMQTCLTVASAVGIVWAVKPFLHSALFRLTSVVFYFLQIGTVALYFLNRPDHHAPLNLLLILLCGFLFRYFADGRNKKALTAAGVLGGLCVWNCIEGFLIFYIVLAGVGIVWLLGGIKLKALRRVSTAAALTVTAAWLANPPFYGWFYPDRNRISVFYAAIALITAAVFAAGEGLSRKFSWSRKKEIFSVLAMAAAGIGFFILLFGAETVFAPVYSKELVREWAVYIGELKPVPLKRFFTGVNLLYPAMTAFSLFFCLRRSGPERNACVVVLTAVLATMLLTLRASRFFRDYGVFCTFLVMFVFSAVKLPAKKSPVWGAAFALGVFMFVLYKGLSIPAFNKDAVFRLAAKYLPPPSGSVLSSSSDTPAIVWHTGYKGIGAPYHSNEEGILDTARMLNEPYDEKTKELLIKHDVRLILINWPNFLDSFLSLPQEEKDEMLDKSMKEVSEHFVLRLLRGKIKECGIKPYPLPPDFAYVLTAYTVDFSECP